jgi:hypothetical protein
VTFDYDLVKGSGRLNDSQVGFDHQIAAIRQSVEGGTPLECRERRRRVLKIPCCDSQKKTLKLSFQGERSMKTELRLALLLTNNLLGLESFRTLNHSELDGLAFF